MNTPAHHPIKNIRVWDWPVRLFHWLLLALCILSWASAEIGGNAMQYHFWSGYTILGLLLFRIMWGLAGSDTARFVNFLRGPSAVLAYARTLFKPSHRATLGHNPLGGWSVAALLSTLATQTISGLFSNDDIANEGPLYHLISKDTSDLISVVHKGAFNVLVALVVLHIAAIIFYRVKHRENLLKPMLNGDKEVHENIPAPKQKSPWLALVFALAAAGVVYGVVTKL